MNKPAIFLIGSGNVATQLGRAFAKAGFPISGVLGRNPVPGKTLAWELNCPFTTDCKAIPSETGIVISAIKDSAGVEVWKNCNFNDALVLHTAGSLPLSALEPFAKNCGVLYPLQSISKTRNLNFNKVPILIESNTPENLAKVRALATSISDTVKEVDSNQRASVHLAAVFANNFTNHMYRCAEILLAEQGLPLSYLHPLIEETFLKIANLSPKESQTGPAVRFDENIMNKHLDKLNNHPNLRTIYQLLSENIHNDYK